MSDFERAAFFKIHADLPREGPGETADVAWAADAAGLAADARILDAASGPGGDIGALLRAAPQGHVTAVDLHGPFIEAAATRWGKNPRVTLATADMTAPEGPFDLVWCAGAVYFIGIHSALSAWRGSLANGGHVAFSEPCFFNEAPSEGARAFWGTEDIDVGTEAKIRHRIAEAGYQTVATRPLSPIAWESYYRPLEARIDALARGADPDLTTAVEDHRQEIEAWRSHKHETGYLLCVVRPA